MMAVNNCGVIIDHEEIKFFAGSRQHWNGKASIELGEHEGRWYFSTGFCVGNGGQSYAPSIGNSRKQPPNFATRQEAYDAAAVELVTNLKKAMEFKTSCSTEAAIKQAKDIIAQIEAAKQLSLF